MSRLNFRGAYIENDFVFAPQNTPAITHRNPYDLNEIFFEWHDGKELVQSAIGISEIGFSKWRALSLSERIEFLNKLKEAFKKRLPQFEEAIILEAGKARWEAKQEANALISKIDITIASMPKLMEAIAAEGNIGTESKIEWIPRGVCAVIGPFNFPLHLANGHIIPALLGGNSVIFKPSECTPASACLYAEAFLEAGFPKGVFQMIPGTGATGEALVKDSRVKGIFFTGSYLSGERITKSILESRKDLSTLAALEMGGKNASVVHSDAPISKSIIEIITAAYATAGQRCSSTSRLLIHESIYDSFISKLADQIKKITIGDPALPQTFMGPLIHLKAKAQFFKGIENAKKEKFEAIIESQDARKDSCLVSPSLYSQKKIGNISEVESWRHEFFGPNILAVSYRNQEELKELHEATPYGLVSSIFSANRDFFDWCQKNFEVGLVHWNRSSVGASSRLPFGGYKQSGNNYPAGLFSFFYCIRPQGILNESTEIDPKKVPEPLKSLLS